LKTQQTSLTAAQSQLDAAKTALEQAQAALTLQKTPARPEDIAAAKAAVDVAQAQLQTANNLYSNGILVSPIDGVITNVDAKIGETAIPGKTVISMISNEMYKVEVFLNEKDLGRIKKDDAAEITLDAYGPKVKFDASVTDINPAATIQNGLQSYKVTLRFKQGTDDLVRQGMGANVTIKDQQKNNVIAVPEQDVFGTDSTDFVLIDNGRGLIEKQAVAAGLEGLDGFLEITSGLSQNQKIVSFSQ
jgi:RND family efflux transporter MFP subunit